MIGLAILATAASVEPPRTVNGQELGNAEDFADFGPATVCVGTGAADEYEGVAIQVAEGEAAYLTYLGIHSGSVRLIFANGRQATISHGDIWADKRRPGQGPLARRGEIRIYLIEGGREVRYQLFAPSQWYDGELQPMVNIEGDALYGNRSDRRLFDRLTLFDPAAGSCHRKYSYGWGVILDGEPMSVKDTE